MQLMLSALACSNDGKAQELAVPGRHPSQCSQHHDGHAPGYMVLWRQGPHVAGMWMARHPGLPSSFLVCFGGICPLQNFKL